VGPRAGVDEVAKIKKNSSPLRESNPGRPARSLVTVLDEDYSKWIIGNILASY